MTMIVDLIIIMKIMLNDRFVIYRIYWDDESIRFTVIDDEVEYDLYEEPMIINED